MRRLFVRVVDVLCKVDWLRPHAFGRDRCTVQGRALLSRREVRGTPGDPPMRCGNNHYGSVYLPLCSNFRARAVRGGSERLRNGDNVRPNPVLDQRLCGNGDQHAQMLIVGSAASVIPLTFITLCVFVVVQLPGRVRHGDTDFLHSYAFLFFRFHSEAYWYVLVLLVRNLTVALVPILPDAALQLCCLVILLVVSVVSCVGTLPWRVHADWPLTRLNKT